MKTSKKLLLELAVVGAAFVSCSSDHPAPVTSPPTDQAARVPRGGWGPASYRDSGRGADAAPARAGQSYRLCSYEPGEALSDRAVTGVREALVREWRSEALYDDLARQLGRPYPRLERSEERHADALVRLLDAHGQLAPPSPDLRTTEVTSAAQACALALENERASVAMFDRLIADGPPGDVKCVYEHLREMSVLRHIPALQRCTVAAR